jgi:ribonucleoside-diphosphate reductase alpha chain
MELFMKEWLSLIESKSGERGIFNREAAIKKAIDSGRRDPSKIVGVNPCAEITLRSAGVCNLSEVVIRKEDTLKDLIDKVQIATIIGTYQSLLTEFRYVRDIWKDNQIEERLLGVSLTGIMDHPILSHTSQEARDWLRQMKKAAIAANKQWSEKLGINQSVAITTVKPSGTVSQLVDSASGIHPRYSEYYIRTVRADKKDPLALLMRAQGFPVEDCVMKPDSTDIFSFPVQGPSHAVFRNDRTALEQLDHYLMLQTEWTEHNVSVTVYVKDHEWMGVGDWVYQNFDQLAGVSFLPHSDHTYQQAPYTECTKAEYEALLARMPALDWSQLAQFEKDDATVNTKELACTAGVCEIL